MNRLNSIKISIFVFFFITISLELCGQINSVKNDGLGNLWIINELKVQKVNQQGKILSSYSNLLLGEPTFIDTSDPFRILIFFKASQAIAIIDNEANAIGNPIYLSDFHLGEVPMVCRSERGGVLVFHRESFEIVRFDNQFSKAVERFTIPVRKNYQTFNCMIQSGGVLYLGVDNNLILMFDTYGAAIGEIETPFENQFVVDKNFLITTQLDFVYKTDLVSNENSVEVYTCPCNSTPVIINNEMYCFNGNKLLKCEKIEG